MVNGFGGALEVIGVRAVINDLNKYLNDGKRVEAANNSITTATKRLEDATKKTSQTQLAAMRQLDLATQRSALVEFNALDRIQKARDRLSAAQALEQIRQQQLQEAQVANIAKQQALTMATSAATAAGKPVGAQVQKEAAAAIAAETRANDALQRQQMRVAAATAVVTLEEERLIRARDIATAQAGIAQIAAEDKITAAKLREVDANEALLASQTKVNKVIGFASLGKAAGIAVAFAAVGLGAGAISAGSNYQNTLAKIDNLTNLTTEDTKKFGASIIDLTKTIPVSADDLGAAAYVILSSGVSDAAEAYDILKQSAKAAVAGFGDTKEIAVAVTGVINAYGQENISAAQATDVLFAAVKEGRAEISDFATNIGRVTQIGRNLGITFDQIAAATAGLTNVGLPANQAVTALLGILNQIESPSQQAKDALAEVHLTIEQLRASIRDKGLLPALQDMLKAFGNNQQALERLFPDVRGFSGALALLRDNGVDNARILNNIAHASGIVNQAFDNTKKNFTQTAQALRNELNRALLDLGTLILPSVTKGLASTTAWVQKNHDGIINLAKVMLQVAGVFLNNFYRGLVQIVSGLTSAYNAIADVTGTAPLAAAAITLLGEAFIWALPGGPIIKGLLAIVAVVGFLSGPGGQSIADKLGLSTAAKKSTPGVGDLATLRNTRAQVAASNIPGKSSVLKDLDSQISSLEKTAAATAKSTETTDLNLKKLPPDLNDIALGGDKVDKEANKAAEALKKLAEEFKNTGEDAAKVEPLVQGMFGQIGRDLADAFSLTAEAAGQVQGYDAFVRAAEKADNQAFELSKTMATVAEAFKHSATVAQKIVLDLGKTALSAVRDATSALFGAPTREAATLDLGSAMRVPGQLQLEHLLNPQIDALQDKLKEVNDAYSNQKDAIDRQTKLIRDAASQQTEAINDEIDAIKDSTDKRKKLLAQELDKEENAMRLRRLIADRDIDLLDDNIKNLKELLGQSQFEENRRGIEANIHTLEEQKRAILIDVESQYRHIQSLKDQQDALENASDEQLKALDRQKEAIDDNTDAQLRQLDALQQTLEDRNKAEQTAINNQISTLQGQIDKYAAVGKELDYQKQLLDANRDILQKGLVLSDQTLLTENEQIKKAQELVLNTIAASSAVKDLSTQVGADIIPEFDTMKIAMQNLTLGMQALYDPTLVKGLLPNFDAAATRAKILETAEYDASAAASSAAGSLGSLDEAASRAAHGLTGSVETLATNLDNAQKEFQKSATKLIPAFPGIAPILPGGGFGSGIPVPGSATGEFISRPSLRVLGEGYKPEVVLPLSNPRRMREIISQLPPGYASAISSSSGGEGGVSIHTGDVTIVDPRRTTGPIGDMAHSLQAAMRARGR